MPDERPSHKDNLGPNARRGISKRGWGRTLGILRGGSGSTRMEQALREGEELYRLRLENSLDLVTEGTPDGQFIYVSPNSLEILGYRPEELIGRTPSIQSTRTIGRLS